LGHCRPIEQTRQRTHDALKKRAEAEAAIVRQICRLYSGGDGLTRIAKQLDADGVPAAR